MRRESTRALLIEQYPEHINPVKFARPVVVDITALALHHILIDPKAGVQSFECSVNAPGDRIKHFIRQAFEVYALQSVRGGNIALLGYVQVMFDERVGSKEGIEGALGWGE